MEVAARDNCCDGSVAFPRALNPCNNTTRPDFADLQRYERILPVRLHTVYAVTVLGKTTAAEAAANSHLIKQKWDIRLLWVSALHLIVRDLLSRD